MSQNAAAHVTEMVDPEYTVLVKIPKGRLPAPARSRSVLAAAR